MSTSCYKITSNAKINIFWNIFLHAEGHIGFRATLFKKVDFSLLWGKQLRLTQIGLFSNLEHWCTMYIYYLSSNWPGLWNWVFATRNQCEKWVERKLSKAFSSFLPNFYHFLMIFQSPAVVPARSTYKNHQK